MPPPPPLLLRFLADQQLPPVLVQEQTLLNVPQPGLMCHMDSIQLGPVAVRISTMVESAPSVPVT